MVPQTEWTTAVSDTPDSRHVRALVAAWSGGARSAAESGGSFHGVSPLSGGLNVVVAAEPTAPGKAVLQDPFTPA